MRLNANFCLAQLDRYCEQILVHRCKNYDYELNVVFFEELGLRKPDYFLNCANGSVTYYTQLENSNLITSVDGFAGC